MTSVAIPQEFYDYEEFIDFTTSPLSLKDGAPKVLVDAYNKFRGVFKSVDEMNDSNTDEADLRRQGKVSKR